MSEHAEAPPTRPLRIGVLNQTHAFWAAGAAYTEVVLRSLAAVTDPARERVALLTSTAARDLPPDVEEIRVPAADLSISAKLRRRALRLRDRFPTVPGEWSLRRELRLVEPSNPVHAAHLAGLDVVLPVTRALEPGAGLATVGWIPDFQHRFLPDLFSAAERADRDLAFAELARRCDQMILSSHDVKGHFDALYPGAASKARVASFPSLLAFRAPPGDPRAVVARYHLPPKFALVVNQLWAHKNPEIVVDAVAICARRGIDIPVVMVGALGDYRDPKNDRVSGLLQRIASSGPWRSVIPLGRVPEGDLWGLLRAAALVLQPSRFEGWNTTVQDALALGRPLMCSDLPVHREQAPGALGFFGVDRPEALAALLLQRWQSLAAGPDLPREVAAAATAKDTARRFGEALLHAARLAAGRGEGRATAAGLAAATARHGS